MDSFFEKIQSGQRVFIQGGAATPQRLIDALMERASHLENVELIHLHTMGPAAYAEPQFSKSFRVANLFVGPNMRKKINLNEVDYLPCFLSEIPALFQSGKRPLDAALIHVSPPDRHGYCSLGVSVDVTRSAVENAKLVIAQINPQMPRVHGDGFIHVSKIHHFVEIDEPLPEAPITIPGPDEIAIGRLVSDLVENGSTLQIGIGSAPEAVLLALKGHRHLGIHTEMWSDGTLALINCGAVDNSLKTVLRGKTVSSFVTGTKALYDFVDDNPSVLQLDIGYVNDPNTIARNPKVVAINSAVEIDLTGQVCSDSVGTRIISGVGGQMDFMRGAACSPGGKPILAFTSRTKKAKSRIVSILTSGAGVVSTRAHIHYVVTEYGAVDLYGKTLGERSKALIKISHPQDREKLEREWRELYSC